MASLWRSNLGRPIQSRVRKIRGVSFMATVPPFYSPSSGLVAPMTNSLVCEIISTKKAHFKASPFEAPVASWPVRLGGSTTQREMNI